MVVFFISNTKVSHTHALWLCYVKTGSTEMSQIWSLLSSLVGGKETLQWTTGTHRSGTTITAGPQHCRSRSAGDHPGREGPQVRHAGRQELVEPRAEEQVLQAEQQVQRQEGGKAGAQAGTKPVQGDEGTGMGAGGVGEVNRAANVGPRPRLKMHVCARVCVHQQSVNSVAMGDQHLHRSGNLHVNSAQVPERATSTRPQ